MQRPPYSMVPPIADLQTLFIQRCRLALYHKIDTVRAPWPLLVPMSGGQGGRFTPTPYSLYIRALTHQFKLIRAFSLCDILRTCLI
jgi:hypothetical protein